MNESIEEWLSKVTCSDSKVWVENPETIKESGFMGKSYTTFRVLLKSSESELIAIRHRFSEFVLLRDILRDRYTQYGILVPSLPQKKVLGALDKEFVTERMHGLTLFAEALVANPWLRKDPTWLDFMSSALPPSGPKKGQESIKTPSEQMLQNILDRLPIPSTPLERIYELKDEITAIEKQLQATLDATRVVQKQQAALSAANQSLLAAFEGWSAVETNPTSIYLNAKSYEANSCSMKLRDEEKVPILVSKMTSSLQDRVTATQDLSEYSTILLSTYIEHELARIYSIKELVKYHDDLVTSIDTLRVKVEKLEVQASAKIDQLQDLKKQLEAKKLILNSFYKGFYFFSLPLNAKLRSVNIRKIVSNYGATKLVASYTLLKSSKLLLSDLLISPTSAISDTSQILDILALKPLDEPPEGLAGPNEGLDTTPSWIESLYYSALQSITAPGFYGSPQFLSPPSPPVSSPTSQNLKVSSNTHVEPNISTLIGEPAPNSDQKKSKNNPFDNVDAVVSGTSIGGGEIKKTSSNPFDDDNSSSPSNTSNQQSANDIKIVPVASPVKVNQNLLGDLLGDGNKDDKSSIWG